jgi:hypothetical protein
VSYLKASVLCCGDEPGQAEEEGLVDRLTDSLLASAEGRRMPVRSVALVVHATSRDEADRITKFVFDALAGVGVGI